MRRSIRSVSAIVFGLNIHKESTYTTILDPDSESFTLKKRSNDKAPTILRLHEVEKAAMEASRVQADLP